MKLFRPLFKFSSSSVSKTFQVVSSCSVKSGLKLLSTHTLCAHQPHGKLLIITPRTSGKAHQRNLLRRRLKSIFFQHKLYELPITGILLTYKQAHRLDFKELEKFLCTAYQQCKKQHLTEQKVGL